MSAPSNNSSSVQSSTTDPKRKMNPCDQSNLKSPVRIKMSHRSFSLSPELRSLREQIFKSLPQHPHFRPISNYCNSVREGLKLGLDVVFLNLTQKLSDVVDPEEFLSDMDELIPQLTELEEMGYDVTKVWERFDNLRRIANQEKSTKQEIEEAEMREKDLMVKVNVGESRVLELEDEIKKLKAALRNQKTEIKGLESDALKLKDKKRKLGDEFTSTAQAAWK